MSRGGGRGSLLQQLKEYQAQSSTSSNSNEQIQQTISGSQNVETRDSGIGGSRTTHSPTLGGVLPHSTGRGRLLEMLSSCSSSSNEATAIITKPSTAIGRGQLLNLKSLTLDAGDSVTELASTKTVKLPPTVTKLPDIEIIDSSKDELEPVIKRGTKGFPVQAVCNYIRLKSNPKKGVFQYEVKFTPNVDSRNNRIKYLNEHRDKFGGTKTFDGVTLYLPILLPDAITNYYSENPVDSTKIKIDIIYRRKQPLRDCMHLYNVLFDRIMKTLNYVRFDRKQYDPTSPKMIPQHKLEVWPGYVTAVDEYEDGIMLCCDVSHRILCQTTVLETLAEAYHGSSGNFQDTAKKALLGSVVLTRYNNKTYRIDDIDFNLNPMSTFQAGDKQITFAQYYKNQYNITIKDLKQPLLSSIKKQRVSGSDTQEEIRFSLVPEICYLTGLRDEMRSDFKVMKDIATHTKVTPNQRLLALEKFYCNVNNCPDAKDILENWGLRMDKNAIKLTGRQLEEERIIFAKDSVSVGHNADFGRAATSKEILEVVNLTNWLLMFTRNDSKIAQNFVEILQRIAQPMGIQVCKPQMEILTSDRNEVYVQSLRNNIKPNTQIVVLIFPTLRSDRYDVVKKICCSEIPVPSQVINAKTLKNESKNRSIIQKIALQMNCKMGGSLWSIKIPFRNVMICGIDSFHSKASKGNSVSAFVASLNDSYTKWYSRAIIQTKSEEIVNGLCASMKFALQQYLKLNNRLPDKIILYRDGVGDGQLKICSEYEVPQILQACKMEHDNYNPLLTYIVVQKRINTRIFMDTGKDLRNPNPGFILDHTVTRRYMYDFFLVSQIVKEGTVTPTHFIVVHDSAETAPDILQRLSYKLCFLYYNWPGTVRVPACCQYAHKLAYLVGQSINKPTSECLSTKLFYL